MGERHLIYVRINHKNAFAEDKEIYYNQNVIGLHVQWLLGYSAVNCLVNMLDFHFKNGHFSPFQLMASDLMNRQDLRKSLTNAEKVLQALYTVCPITGFWENNVNILEKDAFFYADNNTGITIVDFLDFAQPKYCFLNPNTPFVDNNMRQFKPCEPLDAPTYLTAFGQSPENWQAGHLTQLLEKIAQIKVLTKAELLDIFLPKNQLNHEKSLSQIEDFLGIAYQPLTS